MSDKRIYLSPPHMGGREIEYIKEVFASNWIAPLGPRVDEFERKIQRYIDVSHAAALASGTAALHLALILSGVQRGDQVWCSTLTFSASANPIVYVGAEPVFIDSDPDTWNLDPNLLAQELQTAQRENRLPKALIAVHIYGQSLDLDPIKRACEQYDVVLIEDAAEALGTTYKGRKVGSFGAFGILSFNGNKLITTSGGGMLISEDPVLIEKARFLATQARDQAPHYEHSEIGYNYRLSNVLAAIGCAQIDLVDERIKVRRANFDYYQQHLSDLEGLEFMPEADYGQHNRWLTTITLDPDRCPVSPEQLRQALEARNIESRPVWKPMHLQPVFKDCTCFGGEVAESLFKRGLCLPSGSSLTLADLDRIIGIVRETMTQN